MRHIRPEPGELAGVPSPAGGGRTHLQCLTVAERADQSPEAPRAASVRERAPWLQRESPPGGRQSRERHIQLPGEWRAQSYSGRGRRDPSSRVLLQLTKVAEGNFHSGQNQYWEKSHKRPWQGGPSPHRCRGVCRDFSSPEGPGEHISRLRSFPPMRLAGSRAWQRSMPPA